MRNRRPLLSLPALILAALLAPLASAEDFVTFESGQVRPLAMSPDGTRVFAVNTPDNRLEIFDVAGGTLVHAGSVAVGLEPVAVAARDDAEVWVVNHLSDSVSVVDVGSVPPRVTQTLLVGDEPRDIVFAGPGGDLAFVSAAHRGQNNPNDPQLATEGVGRADVWVFDATNLGAGMGGDEVAILTFFGDTPRALATDGDTVWVGVFHSGNQTTVINEAAVCNGGATAPPCNVSGTVMPGGLPAPNQNAEFVTGPEVGLIVRRDPGSGGWEDELGRDWSAAVRFDLPDYDVFGIDATTFPPVANGVRHAGVGTINMNALVNPANGKIYVTNTEARNEVRFEGPGDFFGNSSVIGHLHEARITVIDGASVQPRHLNKHIDYDVVPSPPGTKEKSLAIPTGMAATSDGSTLYVAAFGSSKVGIFDTTELENDTFTPSSASHVTVSGGGPSGLVLDETNDRLYVFTRFDNSISVVDTNTKAEVDHVPVFNPEPPEVVDGRRFLYDATLTSSNGEASCASCHIFGDLDSLAWDLGNPDEDILNNPLPMKIPVLSGFQDFHPLKGPMTTQTLRGMSTHGSMHWRGDRTGGNDPGGSSFDEDAAFKKFNPAFVGLLGRDAELSAAQMQAFTDFILTVELPPNPIRSLDNSLTPQQQAGLDLFQGRVTDTVFNCEQCHRLAPQSGFFGSDGDGTFENETQAFKVAHMRNLYQKVGMFGMSPTGGAIPGSFAHTGDQVRGYGYLHDGSVDTIFRFVSATVFSVNDQEQRDLEAFSLVFDTDFAPIVGQQITLDDASALEVDGRIDLLIARADAGECDVVVKGILDGEERGGVLVAGGNFQMDRAGEILTDAALRAEAQTAGQQLTYTCVPPGSGTRIGVDRDGDGFLDRDELDGGFDPADPGSSPPTPTPTPQPTPDGEVSIRATTFQLRDDATPPINPSKRRLSFKSSKRGSVPSGVETGGFGEEGDPTAGGATGGGATLWVYKVGGEVTDVMTMELPAEGWQRVGKETSPGYRYSDKRAEHGPISSVKLVKDKLTVKGRGAGLYELANAPQGVMGFRLRLGTGDVWCTEVAARAPAFKFDSTQRFFGDKNADAPEACSPVPGATPTPTPTPVPTPTPNAYGSTSSAFLSFAASLLD